MAKSTNNMLTGTLISVMAAFCAFFASTITVSGQERNDISLVTDGKSTYTIVISSTPTVQEEFSAGELSEYLKQISGAELPIKSDASGPRIIVAQAKNGKGPGDINFTEEEAQYDAFVIKTVGQNLYLVGSNKRAVLYAVYTLLEKYMGCRWMTFGEVLQNEEQKKRGIHINKLEEYVPASRNISLPATNDRQKASMKYRGFIAAAWFGNTPINIVDWAAKNKMNFFFLQTRGYVEAEEWNDQVVQKGMIPRGFILVVGHHSFRYFLDPAKYFKDHPDWFAMKGGKRDAGESVSFKTADAERSAGGQFCLSNPDAVKTFRENFIAFAKAHPEVDIYAPGPNDGYGWCECPKCTKNRIAWEERPKYQAVQDLYLRLVNQINEDLQKLYPHQGKRIGDLAYVNYSQPPSKEKLPTGLFVSYAFFTRNWFTVPWGNAQGKVPNGPFPFRLNSKFLEKWTKLTKGKKGDVTIYEYYTGRSAWGKTGFYLMHLISDELDYFNRIGISGAAVQVHFKHRKTVPANLYIFAKKMWDTSLSADEILADYAKTRFGKAAEPMLKYLNEAERNSREFNKYFVRGKEPQRDKSLEDCQRYLDEAKALAGADHARNNIDDEQANFNNLKAFQLGK